MKTERKRKTRKPASATGVSCLHPVEKTGEPLMLKDAALAYEVDESPMIRTQIYLSKPEHEFIQGQAARQAQPMAAIIRAWIDEKMDIPESAWTDNPLLAPPADRGFVGPEDGAINHDHYVHGGPKKWVKRRGQWVEAPPLPEDYHSNPARAAAHDRKIEEER
jgi:hypothetical protein